MPCASCGWLQTWGFDMTTTLENGSGMSRTPKKELKARFKEAREKITGAWLFQDTERLADGISLMRETEQICRKQDNPGIAEKALDKIRDALNISNCVASYRANKANEPFLDLMLAHFCPYIEDIYHCVVIHQQDGVGAKLVKSLIKHESGSQPDSYRTGLWVMNQLMHHLAQAQSPVAYGLMLAEHLRRLAERDADLGYPHHIENQNMRVFVRLNEYTRTDRSCSALPAPILDALARHPFQLLAEHRKYHDPSVVGDQPMGGVLDMHILKDLCERHASDAAVMDVVAEIAGNTLYEMNDIREIRWAEEGGVSIEIEDVIRKFILDGREKQRTAALYYLLCSPNLTKARFDSMIGKYKNPLPVRSVGDCLATALAEFEQAGENDQRLISRMGLLVNRMMEIDQDNARTLMKEPWFPTDKVMGVGRLRDNVFASDLGL